MPADPFFLLSTGPLPNQRGIDFTPIMHLEPAIASIFDQVQLHHGFPQQSRLPGVAAHAGQHQLSEPKLPSLPRLTVRPQRQQRPQRRLLTNGTGQCPRLPVRQEICLDNHFAAPLFLVSTATTSPHLPCTSQPLVGRSTKARPQNMIMRASG